MATWSRDKVDSSTLNSGNQYDSNSQFALDEMNAIVNGGLYSQDFAEALADTPDTSEAGNIGTPSVSLVDNVKNGKTYKKFKFSNIKGQQGTQGIQGETGTVSQTETIVNTSGSLSQELLPNIFYNFTGSLTSLTITFGVGIIGKINEYDFQFVSGSSAPTISVPNSVNWVDNGVYIDNIEANKTYQVSILNNIGIIVGV